MFSKRIHSIEWSKAACLFVILALTGWARADLIVIPQGNVTVVEGTALPYMITMTNTGVNDVFIFQFEIDSIEFGPDVSDDVSLIGGGRTPPSGPFELDSQINGGQTVVFHFMLVTNPVFAGHDVDFQNVGFTTNVAHVFDLVTDQEVPVQNGTFLVTVVDPVIPEPSSLTLLGSGTLGLMLTGVYRRLFVRNPKI